MCHFYIKKTSWAFFFLTNGQLFSPGGLPNILGRFLEISSRNCLSLGIPLGGPHTQYAPLFCQVGHL